MRYVVRTVVGLGLLVGSLVAIAYAVYQLLGIGTCADGGPYVVARPCPEGTDAIGLALPIGIFVMIGAAALYAARGAPPGSQKRGDPSIALLILWSGLFLGIGFACFWGVWGPDANPGPGGELGGLIVGFLFVPMGLIPLLALPFKSSGKKKLEDRLAKAQAKRAESLGFGSDAAFRPAPVAPNPKGDRELDLLTRLERLQELREKRAIDEAEFERLKAEVLGS